MGVPVTTGQDRVFKHYSVPGYAPRRPQRSGLATGTLEASVGPRNTIGVRQPGGVARRVDPGKYLIIVSDRSKSLNFHLKGPGVDKVITSVGFTGTK